MKGFYLFPILITIGMPVSFWMGSDIQQCPSHPPMAGDMA